MSLGPLNLQLIRQGLAAGEKLGCTSRRVISLGYPDILARPEQLEQVLGAEMMARVGYRGDADSIRRWHGVKDDYPIAEAASVFLALGYALDVIDVAAARGGELLHDLNEPLPETLSGSCAAVIDAGTLEHCFNIGQAVKNVAGLVAVNGFVMHGNPLNMFNHGFYNLSPVWYHDFYRANGFVLETALLVNGEPPRLQTMAAPLEQRFGGVPDNTVVVAVARRREIRPIAWPIQGKYVANPLLKG